MRVKSRWWWGPEEATRHPQSRTLADINRAFTCAIQNLHSTPTFTNPSSHLDIIFLAYVREIIQHGATAAAIADGKCRAS